MYLADITPAQINEAIPIVNALRDELRALVVGRTRPSFACGCGAIKHGVASAVDVKHPSGYPAQMTGWVSWSVLMLNHADTVTASHYSYSCGLSEFLQSDDLSSIFERHWRGFCVKHAPKLLEQEEARRAPGGDLYGRDGKPIVDLWF